MHPLPLYIPYLGRQDLLAVMGNVSGSEILRRTLDGDDLYVLQVVTKLKDEYNDTAFKGLLNWTDDVYIF